MSTVFEDAPDIQNLVKGLTAERFAVDVASEGDRVLELALAYSYDLVILDLMLPGLSGTEALRLVRRQNEHVWDQSFDGATNIVDVYVRRLIAR